MTTLIKLGGSLITDKRRARSFRRHQTGAIARQINRVVEADSQRRLIIGHGSGSFGHYEADRYDTIKGVSTPEQWLGFAKVGEAALALSHLVLQTFVEAGLPAMRIQPSSLIKAAGGRIESMNTAPVDLALSAGLLPIVHGDIALDRDLGGTIISTEQIFARLARDLLVSTIVLLGEVEGVLDADQELVTSITPKNIDSLRMALGQSDGVDVTGGMLQKVTDMLALVEAHPRLRVIIANGARPDVLLDLLLHNRQIGTLIQLE